MSIYQYHDYKLPRERSTLEPKVEQVQHSDNRRMFTTTTTTYPVYPTSGVWTLGRVVCTQPYPCLMNVERLFPIDPQLK